jgi:hypothetical protein
LILLSKRIQAQLVFRDDSKFPKFGESGVTHFTTVHNSNSRLMEIDLKDAAYVIGPTTNPAVKQIMPKLGGAPE